MKNISMCLVVGFLFACGGEETGSQQQAVCTEDERADLYVAGLERTSTGGGFQVKLVEGTPAPPDRGNNTWALEIVDNAGAPMMDAEVRVKAWMPDHGHGTNPLWNEAAPMNARYMVGPMNLFMPGLWEFTISVEANTQAADTAVMKFCVEG